MDELKINVHKNKFLRVFFLREYRILPVVFILCRCCPTSESTSFTPNLRSIAHVKMMSARGASSLLSTTETLNLLLTYIWMLHLKIQPPRLIPNVMTDVEAGGRRVGVNTESPWRHCDSGFKTEVERWKRGGVSLSFHLDYYYRVLWLWRTCQRRGWGGRGRAIVKRGLVSGSERR